LGLILLLLDSVRLLEIAPAAVFGVLLAAAGVSGLFDPAGSLPSARDGGLVPETALLRKLCPTHRRSGRVDLVDRHHIFGGLATRKPTLLFSFVGVLLLRLEDCRLLSLLFQEPPRRPRDEPAVLPPATLTLIQAANTALRKRQLWACAAWPIHACKVARTSAAMHSPRRHCHLRWRNFC